jgi:hypothetical protein
MRKLRNIFQHKDRSPPTEQAKDAPQTTTLQHTEHAVASRAIPSQAFASQPPALEAAEPLPLRSQITDLSRRRPERIEIFQIRNWRKLCHSTHGNCCTKRYSDLLSSRLNTLTFVDVHAAALITLPSLTPYVALSYVWGSVKVLKAFKSNVEDLKRPGALAKDDIGIPDTIRDAMHLVKSLGERYLWVDCT